MNITELNGTFLLNILRTFFFLEQEKCWKHQYVEFWCWKAHL